MSIFNKNSFIFARKSTYFFLYCVDKVLFRKNNIFILCYHSISNDNWFYSVKFTELQKQINYLKEKGYQFISLDDVYNHVSGTHALTSPSVALTIDDGYADILRTIEYFDQEKINPALFMVSNPDKVNRNQLASHKNLLTTEQLNILQGYGWEIGAHSATHSNLSKIKNERLNLEVSGSKADLENRLGTDVDYFAYPFGAYDEDVLNEVKSADFKMALTMDDGSIRQGVNVFKIPRIGVNNTHSLNEFKTIFSPSVVSFRKKVKEIIC